MTGVPPLLSPSFQLRPICVLEVIDGTLIRFMGA
jgi:hypothetical protein